MSTDHERRSTSNPLLQAVSRLNFADEPEADPSSFLSMGLMRGVLTAVFLAFEESSVLVVPKGWVALGFPFEGHHSMQSLSHPL